ncbi:MAG TPA: hypothetical protein PKE66_07590, partial [Pyrinomonadaceae bacterium]|nr:hypothetical protein [Pyrinomonadaceae bacterium]
MNRNNFLIHFAIALVLITIAGVLGQIDRWRSGLRPATSETRDLARNNSGEAKQFRADAEPEVLVRFKPGVSRSEIERLTRRFNDRIEDRLEHVRGLKSIDDLDNADPEAIAAQYRAMADLVDYAEPNFRIETELPDFRPVAERRDEAPMNSPNDPYFTDQWALFNSGENGGKSRADIDAQKAWEQTKGSEEVVVAVLDTGVDYIHPDLVANMWTRPDNVPQ